jgi:hypothetical protein
MPGPAPYETSEACPACGEVKLPWEFCPNGCQAVDRDDGGDDDR